MANGLPSFLEDTAKDYATQATAAYKTELQPSTFMGPQFVAGEDPLQTQAIGLAQQGVGAYQPYLTAAQQALTTQGGLTGATAYQPFMSPYQQDVIDTSLTEFDKQAAMRQQQLKDQAVGMPGAFGGGREGVQQAEYQAGSDRNRAMLQAGLLQQGYGQAQTAAQQAFQNQAQLGSGLMNLSNFQRAGLGADVGALGQMGSLRQGQEQARLTAQQQMKQAQAYEPYGRLSAWGQGLTGLTGGVAAAQYQQPQQQSPWSSSIKYSMLGVGGLYQKMFHPQPMFGNLPR